MKKSLSNGVIIWLVLSSGILAFIDPFQTQMAFAQLVNSTSTNSTSTTLTNSTNVNLTNSTLSLTNSTNITTTNSTLTTTNSTTNTQTTEPIVQEPIIIEETTPAPPPLPTGPLSISRYTQPTDSYVDLVKTSYGSNYNLVENYNIGEATWTSTQPRILKDGVWVNYALKQYDQKIEIYSNSVGTIIYDLPTCSYSIYENGYNGQNIIPSVSAVATANINGVWQNLEVNEELCSVNVVENLNGATITATKTLTETVTENNLVNGTSSTSLVNTQTFVHEIQFDINKGIKETFKVWNVDDVELGISQTVHTGELITVGQNTIDIAQANGQSFDRAFLEANEAQVFEIANGLNYDFDLGFDSLSNVNIFYDGDYKVNLDYADGGFVNYLEIDPTFTSTTVTDYLTYTNNHSSSYCDANTDFQAGGGGGGTTGYGNMFKETLTGWCVFPSFKFDISSLPTTAIVSQVDFGINLTLVQGAENCQLNQISIDPATHYTNISTYPVPHVQDILDGNSYASNDSFCTTTGSKSVTLASSANTDVQNQVSSGWFGVGMYYESTTRDSAVHKISYNTSSPTLTVTYIVPTIPQPPTNLVATDGLPVGLSYSAPSDDGYGNSNGAELLGYKVYRADNPNAQLPLPDNGGSNGGLDFADNELLLHGESIIGVGRDSTYDAGASNSPTTGVTGIIGNAWSLDGSNDNIYVNQPVLPTGTSDFTLSLWFNTNSLSVNQEILRLQNSAGSSQFEMWYSNGNNALMYYDGTNSITIEPKTNLSTNTWYNLVVLRSSGTDYIYLNNVLKTSDSSGSITTSHNNWYIGSRLEGSTEVFNGELDELAIWNKALSTNEISTLYNSGSGTTPDSVSPTDLRVYYDFEQTGSTLENQGFLSFATTDNSPNSLTVTATSGTTTTGQLNNAISTPNLEVTSSLLPDATDSFTVGSWVKQTATPTNKKLFGFTNSNGDDVAFNVGTTTADFVKDSFSTVFTEDYSTNSGWTQVGSLVTVNSGYSGAVGASNTGSMSDQRVYKSLGTTLGTDWTINFEYQTPSGLANSVAAYPIYVSTGTEHAEDTGDKIGVFRDFASGSHSFMIPFFKDGANAQVNPTVSTGIDMGIYTNPNAGTWYYFSLTKSGNTLTLKAFTDSARTNQFGNTVTLNDSNLANVSGLSYLQHTTMKSGGWANGDYWTIDNTSIGSQTTNTIISATGLADNTSAYHHYALTRDGSSWTLYQDGSSVATATDSTDLGTVSGSHEINLDGSIDEYFIDSTALTSAEINNAYDRAGTFTFLTNPNQATYAQVPLPNNGGSDAGSTGDEVDFTDNELLLHGTTTYKIHTFTSSDTFEITSGSGNIEYLVVAGGGGGGKYEGGGGGAGGVLTGTVSKSTGSYTVTVGAGGAAGNGVDYNGANGDNSVFDNLTAIGGGGGGGSGGGSNNGKTGGSGGGGGGAGSGGAGTTGQGNAGGAGGGIGGNYPAGGGGGAGQAGQAGSGGTSGDGGDGIQSSISGTPTYYAGGGGGGIYASSYVSSGGLGGGGAGQCNAVNGQANTGGGGGGESNNSCALTSGGAGGSGIVIVRYVDDGSITATGGTVTTITSNDITDSSPNTLTVTKNSGTTTTGVISNAISTPNLEVTSSLLPDGTDSFTVGSWVIHNGGSSILEDFSSCTTNSCDGKYTLADSTIPDGSYINTTLDKLDFSFSGDGTNDGLYGNIGTIPNNFKFRTALTLTSLTQDLGSYWCFGLTDTADSGWNTNRDGVGFRVFSHASASSLRLIGTWVADNNSCGGLDYSGTKLTPNELTTGTYYLEIIRTGNNFVGNLYSDSAYTSLVQSSGTITTSNVDNLQYLFISNYDGSVNGNVAGSITPINIQYIPTNTKLFGFTNANGEDSVFNIGTTTADFSKSDLSQTDFTSDFSTSTGWTTSDSNAISVDTTNEDISWTVSRGTNDSISYDLGAGNISDSEWVLRFEMNWTSMGNQPSNQQWIGLSSTNYSSDSNTSQDFLGIIALEWYTPQPPYGVRLGSTEADGTALVVNGDSTLYGNRSPNTWYYIEVKRTSTTTFEFSVSSTDAYDGDIHDSGSLTTTSTLNNLRYIKFVNENAGSDASTTTSETKNIQFWNGVSDPTVLTPIISATGLTDNTSNFQHYALSRDGSSWTLYQNGASVATATDSTNLGSVSGTSRDSSKDGTGSGTTTGVTGKVDSYAWDFDTADSVNTNNKFNFLHDGSGGSVSVWVNADSYSLYTPIIGNNLDSLSTGFDVIWENQRPYCRTPNSANQWQLTIGGSSLSTGSWNHIVCTINSSQILTYVNGVLVSTHNISGTLKTGDSTYNMQIGKTVFGNGHDGKIDQVLFYDKVLSSSEVSALYNSGSGTSTPSTTNLVLHYNFEQSGTTLENQVYLTTTNPHTINIDGSIDEYFIDSTALSATEIQNIDARGESTYPYTTTSLTFNDNTVVGGEDYAYRVSALNDIGESTYSNIDSAQTVQPANAPTNLTATLTQNIEGSLNWTPSTDLGSGNLLKMRIERVTNGGAWNLVTETTSTSPPYVDTTISGGNTYIYRVASVNEAGTGDWSNNATLDTSCSVQPSYCGNAPSFSQALGKINQFILNWEIDNGTGVSGYRIENSSDGLTWSLYSQVPNQTISYTTATDFADNEQVYWRIWGEPFDEVNSLLAERTTADEVNNYTLNYPSKPLITNILLTGADAYHNNIFDIEFDNNTIPSGNWDFTGGDAITDFRLRVENIVNQSGWIDWVTNSSLVEQNGKYVFNSTELGTSETYNVQISVANDVDWSDWSDNYTRLTTYPPPTIVENFQSIPTNENQIDLIWKTVLDDGGSLTKDYEIRYLNNTNNDVMWSTLVTNSSLQYGADDYRYHNHTLINPAINFTYSVREGNYAGWSDWSMNMSAVTFEYITAILTAQESHSGDAINMNGTWTMTEGVDQYGITAISYEIINDTYPIRIVPLNITPTKGENVTIPLQYLLQLEPNLHSLKFRINLQNSTGVYAFDSPILSVTPAYQAQYVSSVEGNYQVNYTHDRNDAGTALELVVNRPAAPFQVECNFKSELFEDGDWQNLTDLGYYNVSQNVKPTRNVYIQCYNDELLFTTVSYGQTNATLALTDFTDQLGSFFGVPLPFLFVIFLAAIFTGRSAPTGIIFLAASIGVMGVMGYFPDPTTGENMITATVWGMLILITGLGIFMGKRFF